MSAPFGEELIAKWRRYFGNTGRLITGANKGEGLLIFPSSPQYEESCLEAALSLLQSLTADECRSASSVSRAIVARVNSRDGTGVLLGSFAGKHASGMHPCRWNGSAPILQRFYRTRTPVRCVRFVGVCISSPSQSNHHACMQVRSMLGVCRSGCDAVESFGRRLTLRDVLRGSSPERKADARGPLLHRRWWPDPRRELRQRMVSRAYCGRGRGGRGWPLGICFCACIHAGYTMCGQRLGCGEVTFHRDTTDGRYSTPARRKG